MNNKVSLTDRKLFNTGDIIIFLVILFFGCIIFFVGKKPAGDTLIASIYENGKILKIIDLDNVEEAYEFSAGDGGKVVIRVEKGRIRYISSECRDKICVNSGWLSQHGDFAACAPLKSAISVKGRASGEDEPDFILN